LFWCAGTIENNTITGNIAEKIIYGRSWGGGLARCGGYIQNNKVSGNSAYYGGGLALCHTWTRNNLITGNLAYSGGGFYDCDGTIENNTVTANAAGYGGAMSLCDDTIEKNTISGNTADAAGGGLNTCQAMILKNAITGNRAGSYGGGLYWCDDWVFNNTIVGNSANLSGGGLHHCGADILNCIIWANSAPSRPQLHDSKLPTYSCIEDWKGGEGNIRLDPQFVSPGHWDDLGTPDDPKDDVWVEGDYHLLPTSPCIGSGKNEDWMTGTVDLDGNPRILPGYSSLTVDMGAYEHRFPLSILKVEEGAGPQTLLTWASRRGATYIIRSSPNLLSGLWVEEATIISQGSSCSWLDPDALSRQKFYRIELR
jgi:hypothetical protein